MDLDTPYHGSMSWSLDMRCLYCDGKLPLYRKLTHGQFCSTAHSKAYWQEQEQLAIERLHQAHPSVRTHRSPVALEALKGPTEFTPAELTGFVTEVLAPHWSDVMSKMAADPYAFEPECRPEWPALTTSGHPRAGYLRRGTGRPLQNPSGA